MKEWGVLLAIGTSLVVGGASGYPGFGLDSDDRLYLTVGTLLLGLGLGYWRERTWQKVTDSRR